MRIVRVAMIATGVLLAGGAAGAAATGRPLGPGPVVCKPFAARTLSSDGKAIVYSFHGSAYGCVEPTGPTYKLGSTGNCVASARVDHVALAGSVVAYGLDQCGVDTGTSTIEVRRLTDDRAPVPTEPAITGPLGVESYESIGSLVVRADGAAAWIARAASIVGHGPVRVEVHRVDRSGRAALLDSGAQIALGSLRLSGSRLTWRHGSRTRHSTLR